MVALSTRDSQENTVIGRFRGGANARTERGFFRASLTASTALSAASLSVLALMGESVALPVGGNVVSGSADITYGANSVTIQQGSERVIIEWQGFDIGAGESVDFIQQDFMAALNRVLSGSTTEIAGSLSAAGQIVISNPAGIVFTETAQVNVGSIVATSLDIINDRFMAGDLVFDQPGYADAVVSNQGSITVAEAGLAALVAPGVENSGVIAARAGTVVLASGTAATIDLYGDGLVQIAVTEPTAMVPVDADGNPLDALVSNTATGEIYADAGTVIMTADAVAGLMDTAINMDGIVVANSIESAGGQIALVAGENAGAVMVSGDLLAMGDDAGEEGGTVHVFGDAVALNDGGTLNVSGQSGGGTILVGGDVQGGPLQDQSGLTYVAPAVGGAPVIATGPVAETQGYVPTADLAYFAAGAEANADAAVHGDGGTVIAWADEVLAFYGAISARGGAEGGDGGFVETSSSNLAALGTVDASAVNGSGGEWLLDPVTLFVESSNEQNVHIIRDTNGNPIFINSLLPIVVTDPSIVLDSTIEQSLNAGTSVTLQTTSSGEGVLGNIIVNAAIEKTSGGDATLTMNAHDNILINAQIFSVAGALDLVLNADFDQVDGSAADIQFNEAISTNGGFIEATASDDIIFASTAANIQTDGGAASFITLGLGDPTELVNPLSTFSMPIISNVINTTVDGGPSGDVLIVADQFSLVGSPTPGSVVQIDTGIDATNGGTITIHRANPGIIQLGAFGGQMMIDQQELNALRTAKLVVGNSVSELSNTTEINVQDVDLSHIGSASFNALANSTVNYSGNVVGIMVAATANTVNVLNGAVTATSIDFDAPTVNLNGDLNSSTISGTATTVNVQSDAAEIQDGIYVASTTGTSSSVTVNVASGTYWRDSDGVVIDRNLRLIGNPGDLQTDGADATAPVIDDAIDATNHSTGIEITGTDVEVSGFVIRGFDQFGIYAHIGDGSPVPGSDLNLNYNTIANIAPPLVNGKALAAQVSLPSGGIAVDGFATVEIDFNHVEVLTGPGVWIEDFSNATAHIRDNEVLVGDGAAGTSGILVTDDVVATTLSINILRNHITGYENGILFASPGAAAGALDAVNISTNTMNSIGNAIVFDRAIQNTAHITIENNFSNSSVDGIRFDGVIGGDAEVWILGNEVIATDDGIQFNGPITGQAAVVVGADGFGNTISTGDEGIEFDSGIGGNAIALVVDNTIDAEFPMDGVIAVEQNGIKIDGVYGTAELLIIGNRVDARSNGILFNDPVATSASSLGVRIVGNTVSTVLDPDDAALEGQFTGLAERRHALSFEGGIDESSVLVFGNDLDGAIHGINIDPIIRRAITGARESVGASYLSVASVYDSLFVSALNGINGHTGNGVNVAGNVEESLLIQAGSVIRGDRNGMYFGGASYSSGILVVLNQEITGAREDGIQFAYQPYMYGYDGAEFALPSIEADITSDVGGLAAVGSFGQVISNSAIAIAGNGLFVGLDAVLDTLDPDPGLEGLLPLIFSGSVESAAIDALAAELTIDLVDAPMHSDYQFFDINDVYRPWLVMNPTGQIAGADDGIDFQSRVTDYSQVWIAFNYRIEAGLTGDTGTITPASISNDSQSEVIDFGNGSHGIVFNGISDGYPVNLRSSPERPTSVSPVEADPVVGLNEDFIAAAGVIIGEELPDLLDGTRVRISRNYRIAGVDDGIHFAASPLDVVTGAMVRSVEVPYLLDGQFGIYQGATVEIDRNGYATIADVDGSDLLTDPIFGPSSHLYSVFTADLDPDATVDPTVQGLVDLDTFAGFGVVVLDDSGSLLPLSGIQGGDDGVDFDGAVGSGADVTVSRNLIRQSGDNGVEVGLVGTEIVEDLETDVLSVALSDYPYPGEDLGNASLLIANNFIYDNGQLIDPESETQDVQGDGIHFHSAIFDNGLVRLAQNFIFGNGGDGVGVGVEANVGSPSLDEANQPLAGLFLNVNFLPGAGTPFGNGGFAFNFEASSGSADIEANWWGTAQDDSFNTENPANVTFNEVINGHPLPTLVVTSPGPTVEIDSEIIAFEDANSIVSSLFPQGETGFEFFAFQPTAIGEPEGFEPPVVEPEEPVEPDDEVVVVVEEVVPDDEDFQLLIDILGPLAETNNPGGDVFRTNVLGAGFQNNPFTDGNPLGSIGGGPQPAGGGPVSIGDIEPAAGGDATGTQEDDCVEAFLGDFWSVAAACS